MAFALAALGLITSNAQPMEQKPLRNANASLKMLAAYKIAKNKSSFALERLQAPKEMKELVTSIKQHQKDLEKGKYFDILLKIAEKPTANTHFLKELENLLDANFTASDEKKNQLLFIAASHGNTAFIDWVIQYGADVNAVINSHTINPDEATALIRATQNNRIQTAQLLVEKGADVNKENKHGNTPLDNAISTNNVQLFNTLVQHKAKIKASHVYQAAYYGRNEMIEELMALGAPLTEEGRNGETPLLAACRNGYTETMDLLLQKGANINARDNHFGRSALMLTMGIPDSQKRENALELLLEHGAQNQINLPDQHGCTPLMLAMAELDTDLITYLLLHGADCNIQDINGRTVLAYFVWAIRDCSWSTVQTRERAKEVLQLLLQHNAPINLPDAWGQTPLILAASGPFRDGTFHFIKALLDARADINCRDNQGKTALDHALALKEDYVIQLFSRYNQNMSLSDRLAIFYHNHYGKIYGSLALGAATISGWYFYKN